MTDRGRPIARITRLAGEAGLDPPFRAAAAMTWAGSPEAAGFVTLDERLADAARAGGFEVLIPNRGKPADDHE